MSRSASLAAFAVLLLAGCASAPDNEGGGGPRPVPDSLPPVAAAVGADDLAAVRDRNSALFQRLVLFDFDNDAVKADYAPMLQAHGSFLGARPAVKIMVQGSADERGSREYNLALGQRRAEAVKRRLEMVGARGVQVEAVSFGEERPRDPGHGEAAWAQNRNAAIAYPGEY